MKVLNEHYGTINADMAKFEKDMENPALTPEFAKKLRKWCELTAPCYNITNLETASPEAVKAFEEKHGIKLPEDFKWFVTNVCSNYIPNEEYTDPDMPTTDFKEIDNLEDDIDDGEAFGTMFLLASDGCSFYETLGIHKSDFGLVYEISADCNFYGCTNKNEVEDEIEEILKYMNSTDFITWLINKLSITVRDRITDKEPTPYSCTEEEIDSDVADTIGAFMDCFGF